MKRSSILAGGGEFPHSGDHARDYSALGPSRRRPALAPVLILALVAAGFALFSAMVSPVQAAVPEPWQMGMQEAATPIMEEILDFHDLLLILCIAISVFVLGLLTFVIFRFNEKRNPVPSKTSHHTLLEVVWTVIPVFILLVIAVPSFRLLYASDVTPEAEMTVKAIGHQWYWSYEYPDHGEIVFDSFMLPDEEVGADGLRLLEVDNRLVLPVDTTVRVLVTSTDVLHAWAVPAFGVKIDTVPGRLNEVWVRATREGVFYGQCSELCGVNHGFMPIAVEIVSKEAFEDWVISAREKFAFNDGKEKSLVLAAADGR